MLPAEVGERIKTVIPISPLADLRPLLRTSMNQKFKMDSAAAIAESPVDMTDRYAAEVTVWVGGEARPALLDQVISRVEAWDPDHGMPSGQPHFHVTDPLPDPERDLLAQLRQ